MQFIPAEKNRGALTAVLVFLAAAAVLSLAAVIFMPDTGVGTRIARAALSAAAWISGLLFVILVSRYRLTSFRYVIRSEYLPDEDDGLIQAAVPSGEGAPGNRFGFVVYKRTGSRHERKDCDMSISDLEEIRDLKAGDGKRRKADGAYGKMKRYNYTVSLMPDRVLSLIFRDGEAFAEIITEYDEDLAAWLRANSSRDVPEEF